MSRITIRIHCANNKLLLNLRFDRQLKSLRGSLALFLLRHLPSLFVFDRQLRWFLYHDHLLFKELFVIRWEVGSRFPSHYGYLFWLFVVKVQLYFRFLNSRCRVHLINDLYRSLSLQHQHWWRSLNDGRVNVMSCHDLFFDSFVFCLVFRKTGFKLPAIPLITSLYTDPVAFHGLSHYDVHHSASFIGSRIPTG